jgi:hypothetical protein
MTRKSLVVFILSVALFSESRSQVEIGGYIKTDNRFRIQESNSYTWNENTLDIQLKANPSAKIRLYSEARLRGFGFPSVTTSADLQRSQKDQVQPWGVEFYEAYVSLSDFLVERLDVRIGRQRMAWGTADKLNPTDNLNPKDLEDLFDFGKHLGTNAIKASYYLGDYTLTGVFVPVFTPAVFPRSDWASAFAQPMALPAGMTIRSLDDHVSLPQNNFKQSSMVALKFATKVLNYDLSLSYFRGRDDLPLVTAVTISPVDALGTVDIASELSYPRLQVIGADFAGQLLNVGIWGEGALIIPQKYDMVTTIGAQHQTEVALDRVPYFKCTIGGDYTFKSGLYVNAQYVHGLFHERGSQNLEDYLVFALRQSFLDEVLKLTYMAGLVEVKTLQDIKNNIAFALGPELAYYPMDNAEMVLGTYIIDGKNSTTFGRVKNNDEVYIKVKYSF